MNHKQKWDKNLRNNDRFSRVRSASKWNHRIQQSFTLFRQMNSIFVTQCNIQEK